MSEKQWAIFALRDIQNALDKNKYEIAVHHLDDAINAIIAIDEEAVESADTKGATQLLRRL